MTQIVFVLGVAFGVLVLLVARAASRVREERMASIAKCRRKLHLKKIIKKVRK